MKPLSLTILAGALMLSGAARAAVIAGTSFEEPGTAAQTTTNVGFGTATGLTYTSVGGELGFATGFTDTRATGETPPGPVDGAETGDFIGVTSFTGTVGAFTDGSQGYQFDDTDGLVSVTLDAVDTTGFTDLSLTFDRYVNATGFESDDTFFVTVNGNTVYSLGETELEANGDEWISESIDLSAYDGDTITIVFGGDNNSATEAIFLDNVEITGNPVPEPATALLGGLGLLALLRRRRR